MEEIVPLYIDGKPARAQSNDVYTVLNPKDNQTLVGRHCLAGRADMETAIRAARAAFDQGPWPRMAIQERADCLNRFASLIIQNKVPLGTLESDTSGKLRTENIDFDMNGSAEHFTFYANILFQRPELRFTKEAQFLGRRITAESLLLHEPVGVCGLLIPWNSPMMLATWALGPILILGNTCVLKPMPWSSLGVLELSRLAREAGIPDGVLNILPARREGADALVTNKGVDQISFTGSVPTGVAINQANARTRFRPPILELGGKAVAIVLPDAELNLAVQGVARGIFRSQGQSCVACSRAIVHESIYRKFVDAIVGFTEGLKIGDQKEASTQFGPVINREHFNRVMDHIKRAKEQGARVLTGADRVNGNGLSAGNYIKPTIFGDVSPTMDVWQNEIFGPVLCMRSFKTEEEAVQLANSTEFGLSSNVWGNDKNATWRLSRKLDVGMVFENCHFIRDLRGFFGSETRSSGNCFVGGDESLRHYSKRKVICSAYYQ